MKQIHIDRLLKLADHLEYGQLGHKVFDFNNYNADENNQAHCGASCGYAGCAIGECPIVFPEVWRFNHNGWPVADGFGSVTRYSIEAFFDISVYESEHLFVPLSQHPRQYGGQRFGHSNPTREQVAANIRAFVALKLPTVERDEK